MATPRKMSFQLTGADGRPLRGDVRTAAPGGRPAVVICHGFKGFKDWGMFPPLAERLARAGMTAVCFNFSGSGVGPDGERFSEPERFGHMTVSHDLADLDAVCERLRAGTLVPGLAAQDRIGLFGHSRGGGTAVLYAARPAGVSALVTWAATAEALRWDAATIERWRRDGRMDVVNARTGEILPLYTDLLNDVEAHRDQYDVLRAAARITLPWLLVHGDADETVPLAEGRALRAAAHGDRVRFLTIGGGSHTFGARHPWTGATPELEQAMDATVEWFVRWLF